MPKHKKYTWDRRRKENNGCLIISWIYTILKYNFVQWLQQKKTTCNYWFFKMFAATPIPHTAVKNCLNHPTFQSVYVNSLDKWNNLDIFVCVCMTEKEREVGGRETSIFCFSMSMHSPQRIRNTYIFKLNTLNCFPPPELYSLSLHSVKILE